MPSAPTSLSPGLQSFIKSLKGTPVESSIEHLISLLKRRQIKRSKSCAVATAHLLLRVVSAFRWTEIDQLIERIHHVGVRLCAAQPRELAVGNIVRRVLGLIREEAEDDRDGDSFSMATDSPADPSNDPGAMSWHRPSLSSSISTLGGPARHGVSKSTDLARFHADGGPDVVFNVFRSVGDLSTQRPPLLGSHTSYAVHHAAPMATSMFNLFSRETTRSPTSTPPGARSPSSKRNLTAQHLSMLSTTAQRDLKPDIIGGIEEIVDELDQVDDQIAAFALDHIHSNEIILTHNSSATVQKFLLKAAAKRKFTVVHAEAFPNDHDATYSVVTGRRGLNVDGDALDADAFTKPLTAAGVTVVLIPDSAVFALMSRVNKVILGTHAVLANGALVAAAGARMIAQAARTHRTPVVIVSGIYKLSPEHPFDVDGLIEYGDAGKVFGYDDGEMVERVDVENPLYDFVPAELVNLYITNLGGHAPSYLYRIVADHYRIEDIDL
ncbi:MAG: GCD complex subunit gcd7 [Phylliscum demangeonii]|nr:MAG: GCD complex subunit gcd7 [Phylliscum demangeonii]